VLISKHDESIIGFKEIHDLLRRGDIVGVRGRPRKSSSADNHRVLILAMMAVVVMMAIMYY
jgi:lysyl-tRNA synthetase class II